MRILLKKGITIHCFLFIGCILMMSSCHQQSINHNRVVVIQPFEGFSTYETEQLYAKLKPIYRRVILKKPIPLPINTYYYARNRYRADSIINFLKSYASADTVIIGITGKDISTTKGKINDWGVMGLGFRPGRACVVSCYRLKKSRLKEQFYKVAIHELGHTEGLPHCNKKNCYMRDAEGGNPLDEETGFCSRCKTYLKKKGWKLL